MADRLLVELAGPRNGRLGDDVTWRARHIGIRWTLTSVITEFERPGYFVDEQRRGPGKRFRNEHHFSELGATSSSMVDVVTVRCTSLAGADVNIPLRHRTLWNADD